jgi:DNA-binding NarL/FixJ family response regulator
MQEQSLEMWCVKEEQEMSESDTQALPFTTLTEAANDRYGSIRIVLVDDHQVVRQGVRAMLSIEEDITVVGDYGSAEEAIPQIEKLLPDIVLLDFRMPGLNGIEACRLLKAKGLACDVIILTLYEEHFSEAMRAGAKGYLPKDMKREELIGTIRHTYSRRQSPDLKDSSASLDTIELVILSPADTDQIVRFVSFAPSALHGSIDQIVKLLDNSTAITMRFAKSIKHKDVVGKLNKIPGVNVVKKKLATKPTFLWPLGGTLRSDKSEKDQIMITLGNNAASKQKN